MICVVLRGDHTDFAVEEAKSIFQNEPVEIFDRVALFNCQELPEKIRGAAFVKEAYEVVTHTSDAEEMYESVSNTQMAEYMFPNESFKINSIKIGPTVCETDIGLLAGFVGQLDSCYVNLDSPDNIFTHLKGTEHIFGLKLWERTEDFNQRRPDKLPAPHPTGMSPFIARSLVNISNSTESILDPFCGAGGFLLEAGMVGLNARGTDIDSRMVERARTNTESFDVEATITQEDGFFVDYSGKTIVTDIPYGRNSFSEQSPAEFLRRFVEKTLREQCRTVCVVYPLSTETISVMSNVASTNFDFEVNSSLTRRVSIYKPS